MSIVFALLLCSLNGILSDDTADVTVIVKGSSTIAETNENFVCATIDWWPPEKCSYNQCPWGQSSVLNLVCFIIFVFLMVADYSYSIRNNGNNNLLLFLLDFAESNPPFPSQCYQRWVVFVNQIDFVPLVSL